MYDSALDETKTIEESLVHDLYKIDPFKTNQFLMNRLDLKEFSLQCSLNLNEEVFKTLQHMYGIIHDLEKVCSTTTTIETSKIIEILNKKLS